MKTPPHGPIAICARRCTRGMCDPTGSQGSTSTPPTSKSSSPTKINLLTFLRVEGSFPLMHHVIHEGRRERLRRLNTFLAGVGTRGWPHARLSPCFFLGV